MTSNARSLLIVSLLLRVSVPHTDAQETQSGRLWGGFGLGYGAASFACTSCDYRQVTGSNSNRLDGWTVSGSFGWRFNRRVRLDLEYRGWLNGLKAGDSLPGIDHFTLFLSDSPRILRGLFVEGGGALTHYTLGLGRGDPLEPHQRVDDFAAGYGWGYGFGAGWHGRSCFTPRVTYIYGKEPRLHAADGVTVATGWRHNVLLLEIWCV
jgi:hypothetical protein